MVETRITTWDKIGTDVTECKNNLDEILKVSGLDYKVGYRPITVNGIEGNNERWRAIVRESDNHVYNIAKNSYTICQNSEAFSLISEMPEDFKVVRAGEAASSLVYLIGELPERKILGDSFKPNLIFQNSHTSDYSCRVAIIPLRVACVNQFNLAFREANNTYTIKHTASVLSQIEAANESMKAVVDYMDTLERKAELLATNRVDVNKTLNILFPINENASERAIEKIDAARDLFMSLYNQEDNQNFKGTAWGVINAATDYATHYINTSSRSTPDSRFINSIMYPEFIKKAQLAVAA